MHPYCIMVATKKYAFFAIVSSERFKCLQNGTLFCQTAWVEIHQAFALITYIQTNQIDDNRFSRFRCDLREMTHM